MTRNSHRSVPNVSARIAVVLITLSLSVSSISQEGKPSNTIDPKDLYAAFLTKFPHFVTWPNNRERERTSALRIGIIGEEVFPQRSINLINAQLFEGRPFNVIELASLSDISELDMLFIGTSEEKRIREIVAAASGKSILTIAAIPRFAHRGGMINFAPKKGYIRFEVNLKQVEKENLRISAKLLRTAIIIEEEPRLP